MQLSQWNKKCEQTTTLQLYACKYCTSNKAVLIKVNPKLSTIDKCLNHTNLAYFTFEHSQNSEIMNKITESYQKV